MSGWWLVEDQGGGVKKYARIDSSTGELTYRLTQDTSYIQGMCKESRDTRGNDWSGNDAIGTPYACVPKSLVEQWWKEMGGNPFSKAHIKDTNRKLNSSEYRNLRLNKGRL